MAKQKPEPEPEPEPPEVLSDLPEPFDEPPVAAPDDVLVGQQVACWYKGRGPYPAWVIKKHPDGSLLVVGLWERANGVFVVPGCRQRSGDVGRTSAWDFAS